MSDQVTPPVDIAFDDIIEARGKTWRVVGIRYWGKDTVVAVPFPGDHNARATILGPGEWKRAAL